MLKGYLGDRTFWRTALTLGLPIALQNLLTSSFILVDTLMVGQLGDVSLSAVGMAGQFGWFMNMIVFGISSGAAVFIAQYWGAGDIKGIRRSYGIALISVIAVCALFCAAAGLFPEFVISIFNREPAVVTAGADYLRIACLSYIATGISLVLSVVLRSTEQVKLPMYVSLFTTVLNAFLDYGLIFGAFGLPEMGIKGAALATVLSSWAGPVITYIISAFQKNFLISPLSEMFSFGNGFALHFFRKAMPVITNETFWGLGTLLFSVIFANLGYQNYAAVTIFRTFENFAFVFFIGLCSACSIMVGKDIGAGNIEEAVENAKRFNIAMILASIVVGAAIVLARHPLASIFNLSGTITEETLATTGILMLIYGIELPVRNMPYIQIVGTFRPGGDTTVGVRLDLLSLWLLSVPATALAAFVLKLPFPAVFAIMYVAEDYVKTFLCLRHFFTYSWLRPVTEQGKAGLERFWENRQKQLNAKA